jgi:hypothetical protein
MQKPSKFKVGLKKIKPGLVKIEPSKWDWRYWLVRYRYWRLPAEEKRKLTELVDKMIKSPW